MLKAILQKFRRQPKALTAREQHGRDNVGYPTTQLSASIDDEIQRYYRGIKPVVKFYKEGLFFRLGPALIEAELTDEQLASLSGRHIQVVYLVLF